MCKPKDEGGLGLRNLIETNNVSCMKLIWRFLSGKNSLWVKWIWRYLIRNGSFWSIKESSSLGFWMWKKLLRLRHIAYQFVQIEISSGATTSFWLDNWSLLEKLIELTGEGGCIALGISLDTTVEKAVQIYRNRLHRVPVFRQIEQEVINLRNRGMNNLQDVCLWKKENGDFKSEFVTSQTWNLVRSHSPKVTWSKGIWFSEATPKFAFLAWLATRNRLATGDRVLNWNPMAITTCWLCKEEMKTRNHIYFECAYSREVRSNVIGNLMGDVCLYQWDRVLKAMVDGRREKHVTFLLRYSFQAIIHMLWLERNTRRVGEASQPPGCIVARLDKLVRNRVTSLRKRDGAKYERAMEVWFGRGR